MISTAGLSWLLMMLLHECGHAWHGWLSGARLDTIHLPLMGFSRTDFAANPHPLFVAWGGPVWGCLFPLAFFFSFHIVNTEAGSRFSLKKYAYLPRWFAGFCLIANGAYLLGGIFLTSGADDGGAILQHGGSVWQLATFGIAALASGLYLWNGLGPDFGLGASQGKVDRKAAVGVTIALLIVACAVVLMASP
jgi:hypothetical protein